jgi:hypothetical protein
MQPDLPLRDIHLPAEPSWWPPAPGWWLLALLLIAVLAFALRRLWRWQRARRRQRALDAEFAAATALPDALARLTALSQLLRRAARLRSPAAAALPGLEWLRFLDQTLAQDAATPPNFYSAGPGRMLLDGPFRPAISDAEVSALIDPLRRSFRSLVRES